MFYMQLGDKWVLERIYYSVTVIATSSYTINCYNCECWLRSENNRPIDILNHVPLQMNIRVFISKCHNAVNAKCNTKKDSKRKTFLIISITILVYDI